MIYFKFKKKFFLLFSFLFLNHCLIQGYDDVLLFPSVGEKTSFPDSDYFYFDLDEAAYGSAGIEAPLYDINTTEHYGDAEVRKSLSNCEIEFDPVSEDDPESSYSENKICILDIMEYDLLVNNLRIAYNIPEGMCRYVHISPPWHYNYQIGPGPSVVDECEPPESESAEEEESSDEEEGETYFCAYVNPNEGTANSLLPFSALTGYGCSIFPLANNEPANTELRCSTEQEQLCPYLYEDGGDEDISCCYGSYRLASDGTTEEWNEEGLLPCIGGPGRTSWDRFTEEGIPIQAIQHVSEYGLKGSFEVVNLLEATGNRSFWSTPIANYLDALDEPPDELRDVSRADDLPVFLQSHNFFPPNPFFEVECLDAAGEVLHKLQLMVREWDTHEEFIKFYEEGGTDSADYDVEGIEGDDCDYEERRTLADDQNRRCNDSLDLGNFKNRSDDFRNSIFNAIFSDGYPKTPYEVTGGGGLSSSESSSESSEE